MQMTVEQQEARVREILDQLRPYLQADGGDCAFDRLEDGVVYIHLKGACVGCPSALMTLKMGIERRITDEIPDIKAVEAV
jgi:Fe-S cluster biogenesis protein NfuA